MLIFFLIFFCYVETDPSFLFTFNDQWSEFNNDFGCIMPTLTG